MGTLTKFEKNSLRKSYRTTVPLFVIIQQQHYRTIDWSLTGFAIEDFPKQTTIGHLLDGQLLLQLDEASITIPVTMRLVYRNDKRTGFAFQQLSDKNKKVLKRFIEYAIEGKLTETNNLISVYEEPEIKTPIHAPVKLEPEERATLNRAFHIHTLKYMLFSLLVLTTLGFLLFSQFRYSYKGSGLVIGNYQKIYPKIQATLEKMYFQEGDIVHPGDMLAQFDTQDVRYNITLLEAEQKQFAKKSKQQTANDLFLFAKQENKSIHRILSQQLKELKNLYQNATIQFNNHLITTAEYSKIKTRYFDAKLKLQHNKMEAIQLKQKLNQSIDTDTQNFDIKIEHAKAHLKDYNLFAPVAGKIYEIHSIVGEVSQINRPLLTIWTQAKPLIEVEIPQSEISKISMDAKVDIFDTVNHQKYIAKVVKIGSIDDDKNTNTINVILKPTTGDTSLLKPHQRVDVLFKRTFQDVF